MVGIDRDIERIINHFESNLWTDKNCEFYGRVYPNEKGDGIIPEVYDTTTNDYKEVLLDDKLDCISFFYVDPTRTLIDADVSIIFAINVKNLYPSYNTRETERAMRDVNLELQNAGVAFNVENVITGINAVEEFTFTSQHKMDMHPFYLFRLECEANYDFNAPCEDVPTVTKYTLATSVDGNTGGIISPNTGQYNAGDTIRVITASDPNYELVETIVNKDQPSEFITTDAWFDLVMDGGKDVVAYFQSLAKQWFLKEYPIFENDELKDYSPSPVNAKLWGYELRDNTGLNQMNLTNNISLDYNQDGIIWEFIVALEVGAPKALMHDGALCILDTVSTTVRIKLQDGTTPLLGFPTPKIVRDGNYYRTKCVVDGNNVTVYTTTIDDADYSSALSQTRSKSSLTNYDAVTNPIVPFDVTYLLSNINQLEGALCYVYIGGYEFNCQDGNIQNDSYHGIISNNIINKATGGTNSQVAYQDKLIKNINGYTKVYEKTGNHIFFLPYINGVSVIEAYKLFNTDNISYEEFPNGEFGEGWGFTLDAQFESLDQDNTYFDISSIPNKIRANSQPTSLNNRIYYDRANNKDIQLYSEDVVIESTINTINKNYLSVGDSVAGHNWNYILSVNSGMLLEEAFYTGEKTSDILTSLQSEVSLDPTLLSRQKFVTLLCCYNDYNQGTTEAQLLIDYRALVNYILSEFTGDLIICLVYNWSLDDIVLDDGLTPSASGLTMEGIRRVQQQIADENNLPVANLSQANILFNDLIDGLHPGTATGNLKIANKVLDTLNTIRE